MTGNAPSRRGSDPLRQQRIPVLGRTYRYRYGYPWRWAILAEIMWRVEHIPHYGVRLRSWGYRWRKHFEHKGTPDA